MTKITAVTNSIIGNIYDNLFNNFEFWEILIIAEAAKQSIDIEDILYKLEEHPFMEVWNVYEFVYYSEILQETLISLEKYIVKESLIN